jgi:spermidine synthase
MAANSIQARRYMEIFAELPYALHPGPERALLVSYGLGSTAAALLREPQLSRLDIVDPSTTILSMSEGFKHPTGDPLKDKRVRVIIDDARHHLSTTSTQYDVITGEPPPPAAAGIAVLFNAETFERMRDRLRPGGFVTWWLPLHSLTLEGGHSIVRAFCQAFPDCTLWNGSGLDLILLGSKDKGPRDPVDAERFARAFSDTKRANALAAIGLGRPEQIGALFIADAPELDAMTRTSPTLTDDDPHRLTTPRTQSEIPIDFARRALNAAASRALFESSPAIARLWPKTLRAASGPFFPWEALLQRTFHDPGAKGQNALGRVPADRLVAVLNTPGLGPLALLLLGSDMDLQRIAGQALTAERPPASAFVQRAIGDLARGDAASSAARFAVLLGTPHDSLFTRQLGALALCLSRDDATALRFLRQQPRPPGSSRFVGIGQSIDRGCMSVPAIGPDPVPQTIDLDLAPAESAAEQ